MKPKKQQIVFERHENNVYPYRVVKLVNRIEPTVGSHHKETAVRSWVENKQVEVVILPRA